MQVPPHSVVTNFRKGLKLFQEGRGGKGLVDRTIKEAKSIASGNSVSQDKANRMRAWFARHKVDYRPGWNTPGKETPGYVAHLLWGGDSGRTWVKKMGNYENPAEHNEAARERYLDSVLKSIAVVSDEQAERILDTMLRAREITGNEYRYLQFNAFRSRRNPGPMDGLYKGEQNPDRVPATGPSSAFNKYNRAIRAYERNKTTRNWDKVLDARYDLYEAGFTKVPGYQGEHPLEILDNPSRPELSDYSDKIYGGRWLPSKNDIVHMTHGNIVSLQNKIEREADEYEAVKGRYQLEGVMDTLDEELEYRGYRNPINLGGSNSRGRLSVIGLGILALIGLTVVGRKFS